jgi:hypothetical protein
MKKKIYIAGKVTGESIAECTMKFGLAQKEIETIGYEVVNPLAVVADFNSPWEVAMKKCIKALVDCDGMVILPCWQNSPGAKIERQLAEDLNITIVNYSKVGLTVLKKHFPNGRN